jgi:uncharacterized protein (TIGR00255 family)
VDTQEAAPLNKAVIEHYLEQLHAIRPLADEFLLPTAMRLPNTLLSTNEELTDEEQAAFLETLAKAADKLVAYRTEEGAALEQDLSDQLTQIAHQQQQIDSASSERIAQRREKLEEQLNQLTAEFNQDRLEQELIFYLEKWDINEELVRLGHHLSYFRSTLKENTPTKGKKLGFIAQEIGREVNTIGSKANDAQLQKCVVMMKDALERIKEQVLNAL